MARFAADLGPVVWKIASKKIESVLPIGVKFSPGWLGENKANEQQQYSYTEKQKSSNNFVSGDHSSRLMSPATSGSNSIAGNRYSLQSGEDMESIKEVDSQSDPNLLNDTILGGIRSAPPLQIQSRNVIRSDMNGFSGSGGGFRFNYPTHIGTVGHGGVPGKSWSDNGTAPSQMFGMVPNHHHATMCSMPATTDYESNAGKLVDCSSRLHTENSSAVLGSGSRAHTATDPGLMGDSSWPGLHKQEFHPFAPDLNVRFLAPGSPISNLQIGSPQQPDLALQL